MDLGVYGMNLPFDDSDEVLMNIIKIKTLPTFSQFSPYYVSFIVDSNDVKKSDDIATFTLSVICCHLQKGLRYQYPQHQVSLGSSIPYFQVFLYHQPDRQS